jgi:hypothetical protein
MPYQVAPTVVAPVRPGAVNDLKHLLATMAAASEPGRRGSSGFARRTSTGHDTGLTRLTRVDQARAGPGPYG